MNQIACIFKLIRQNIAEDILKLAVNYPRRCLCLPGILGLPLYGKILTQMRT